MFATILKSIWAFLKKNWLSILAVIGVVFLLVYGYQMLNSLLGNDTSMQEVLQRQEERHIKELADLNNIVEKQRLAQEQIRLDFDEKIIALDELYTGELKKIRLLQRQRQTQLQNNPTELGEAITSVFGISQGGQQ